MSPFTDSQFQALKYAGNLVQVVCHTLAAKSGWWNHPPTGLNLKEVINNPKDEFEKLLASALVSQKIDLCHTELGEATEGARKNLMDDHLPHRKMVEVELADCVIRCMDLAGAMNLDLGTAIAEKLVYNQQRADHKPENRNKEGGKAF